MYFIINVCNVCCLDMSSGPDFSVQYCQQRWLGVGQKYVCCMVIVSVPFLCQEPDQAACMQAKASKMHCRSSSEEATRSLSLAHCSCMMDMVVVLLLAPKWLMFRSCLSVLYMILMEDSNNENREQGRSNDTALLDCGVNPQGSVSSPQPLSTVAERHTESEALIRSMKAVYSG